MSLKDKIFEAGIVGCGGAGFPTHVKMSGSSVDYLILNGAECEPLLHTDRYMMLNCSDEIVWAADAVRREIGAVRCVIAIKEHYRAQKRALEKSIETLGAQIEIFEFPESFYPAGDEQVMVYEVTGRTVPPAGIPLDVGCVVSNVSTMYCIYNAIHDKPFTHKVLTVTGRVREPLVIKVPLGTPFEDCLKLAGGALDEDYFVLNGGPMMGRPMTKAQALQSSVTKTTSGFIVLPSGCAHELSAQMPVEHTLNRARHACIQCSYCTLMCPRNLIGHPLEPHKIMRKMSLCRPIDEMLDDPDIQAAALCCECGICEIYACPMGLQPRKVNTLIKAELARAGIRYEKGKGLVEANAFREDRKAPTGRVAIRSGVGEFMNIEIDGFKECEDTEKVYLPLKQHIGAPCVPKVSVGDIVVAGQKIAECPENALGTNLHASISGEVVKTDGEIVIERR